MRDDSKGKKKSSGDERKGLVRSRERETDHHRGRIVLLLSNALTLSGNDAYFK